MIHRIYLQDLRIEKHLKKQRSLLVFEQGLKAEATRKSYKDQLDRFLAFCKIQDCDSLITMPKERIEDLVEDYLIHLKNTVHPNSVPTMMCGVKHFFVMNRIQLFWEVIQKMYPEKIKSSGGKSWSTEHIRKMLEFTTSKRNKAIIHFLASTGSRIGVFNYPLQMKHLKDMDNGCKAVLLYAEEKEEYWSFLTPEASKALQDYFDKRIKDNEKFYPETPIFRAKYRLGIEKSKPIRRNAVISMIYRIIKNTGLERTRINRNFDIQMDHGFRKRFNSILKLNNQVNSNIAEKIMGHSVTIQLDNAYLPTHDQRVFEKCFEEFKKAVPELTVDNSERLSIKNKMLEKEKSKLEIRNAKVIELAQWLDQNPNAVESLEYYGKLIKEKFGPFFENVSDETEYDKTLEHHSEITI